MFRAVTQRRRVVSLAAVSVLVLAGGAAVHAVAAPTTRTGTAAGSAATFVVVGPTRVVDTRRALGGSRVGPGGTLHLKVAGHSGVPASGVTAVVLTVTEAEPAASGYVSVYADGTSRPRASSLNFRAGRTVAAQVYAPVGADGAVALYNGSAGTIQFVADVDGYFAAAPSRPGGAFVSTTPTRILDSRTPLGVPTPKAGATAHLQVLGAGPVPASGVSAVAITLTATAPSASGYLTAYADGTARPGTSTLNFTTGATVANLAIVPVAPDGKIALYNGSAGTTPLVGDVVGYYLSGAAGTPGTYSPITPTRFGDGVAQPHGTVALDWSKPALPRDVAGQIVVNATVTQPAAGGYVTLTANNARPLTSSLNFVKGQTVANLASVRVAGGTGYLYNGSAGRARVIGDVVGYYVSSPGFGAITGTVREAGSNVGEPGVRVHAYLAEFNDDGTEAGSTLTGADGTYRIGELPAGTPYVICFDTRGVTAVGDPYAAYASQCYQNQPWDAFPLSLPPDATPETVTPGGTITGIDATLQGRTATGTVAGRVTGAGGAGVAGSTVVVNRSGFETGLKTGADGSYRVAALTPATYTVCVEPGTLTDTHGPYGYVTPPCHDDVAVTAGTTTTRNEQLVAAGAVSGTITTTTGSTIADGFAVVEDSAGHDLYDAALPPGGGAYTITAVPPGTYRVCLSADAQFNPPYGFVQTCVANVVVRAGTRTSGVSEVVVPAGAVTGTVTTQHGGPLYGAVVYVFAADGTVVGQTTSGYDGSYKVIDLPPTDTGYAVCFDGRHAGDPPSVPFSSRCAPDEPWTPTATPAPPADAQRVLVQAGTAARVDIALSY